MLKNKSKFILLLMLVVTLISTLSFATEVTTSENDDIALISENDETTPVGDDDASSAEDWVQSDLYVFEDSPTISKIVNGNAYIFGNEVTITGEIGGDVFVFANKLNIDGAYIYSNLFAFANEINVNGIVYDIYAAANTFTLDSDAFVYRDLRVSANTINLKGMVNKDAYLTANTYNFDTDSGKTLIKGNLSYDSSNELSIADGLVGGTVTYNEQKVSSKSAGEVILEYVSDLAKTIAYVLVVALLCIYLASKFTSRVTTMSTKKSLVSFLIGLGAVIVGIIAFVILLLSVIGVKLAVAEMLLYIVICMSGLSFASLYFGGLLAKQFKQEGKLKLLGLTIASAAIVWVVSRIPVIGGLISTLVAIFGIGTFLVNTFYKKESTADVTPVVETKE